MANTGRIRYRETDTNPGSPTFGQERWGPWLVDETACPPPQLYDSQAVAGFTTKNNCPSGTPGSVYYTVPAGYARASTQAEADAQAQAYYENTRQANANLYGTCNGSTVRTLVLQAWTATGTDSLNVTVGRSDVVGSVIVTLQASGPDGDQGPMPTAQLTIPAGQNTITTDVVLSAPLDPVLDVVIIASTPADYIF